MPDAGMDDSGFWDGISGFGSPASRFTELWQVVTGAAAGRRSADQVTLVDSVGFATEEFSALRYIRDKLLGSDCFQSLDLVADPDEPRDLFGMLLRRGKLTAAA